MHAYSCRAILVESDHDNTCHLQMDKKRERKGMIFMKRKKKGDFLLKFFTLKDSKCNLRIVKIIFRIVFFDTTFNNNGIFCRTKNVSQIMI